MAITKSKSTIDKEKKEQERQQKLEQEIAKVDEAEAAQKERTEKVIKKISGSETETKIIEDKNGRKRRVKVAEKRKSMPVYIPESLYEQFDQITTAYGKSNNSTIVELITDYVISKKAVLGELKN